MLGWVGYKYQQHYTLVITEHIIIFSMNDQNNSVFAEYTPLRNHIRQTNIIASLRAIHAHVQLQHFSQPLPNYIINAPLGYGNSKGLYDFLNYHIFPWELEIIAKESILHGSIVNGRRSLEDWNYLAKVVNQLKSIEGKIAKIYSNKSNALIELYRVAHRQFGWQIRPDLEYIARYWEIYSSPKLKKVIYDSFHLTVEEIYLLGFTFIGVYQDKIALYYPPDIQLKHLTNEHADKFLAHYSLPLNELKALIKEKQEMNEKFVYAYNPLKAYPLIRTGYTGRDSIICPIPTLLYRRITEGLYYEIVNTPGFDEAYGEAFQNFIGKLLHRGNTKAIIYPEETYGHPEKRTTDWILDDSTALLFVECKGKRITNNAKISLLDNSELERQLDIMAGYVVQLYKTIIEYQRGLYPNIRYDPTKQVYPVVVTLEEWYIFGSRILEYLDQKVIEKLTAENISLSILESNPYLICSPESLDLLVQVGKYKGIKCILKAKSGNPEMRTWQLDVYIRNKYHDLSASIKDLFKDDFNKEMDTWLE